MQYLEVLGTVESIILANPMAKFIITGDLNYNIFDDRQLMSNTICEFLRNYDLISTHELDPLFDQVKFFVRGLRQFFCYFLPSQVPINPPSSARNNSSSPYLSVCIKIF